MNKRRIHIDDKALDKITPDSCWVIGWIAADGCVYVGRNKSVVISLSETDIDVLEKIREFFSYVGDFYWRTPNGYSGTKQSATLQLRSSDLVDRLIEIGVHPRKSGNLKFPKIIAASPEDCIRMFVRGYFEGNGSISITQKGKQPKVAFCGSHSLMKSIADELVKFCGVRQAKVSVHSQCEKISEISYKCHPAIAVADWIYGSAGNYCNRKWNKYLSIKKLIAGRFKKRMWRGESVDGNIKISQYSRIGGHMKTWKSMSSAAKHFKTSVHTIKRAADGLRQTAVGYKWKYA